MWTSGLGCETSRCHCGAVHSMIINSVEQVGINYLFFLHSRDREGWRGRWCFPVHSKRHRPVPKGQCFGKRGACECSSNQVSIWKQMCARSKRFHWRAAGHNHACPVLRATNLNRIMTYGTSRCLANAACCIGVATQLAIASHHSYASHQ